MIRLTEDQVIAVANFRVNSILTFFDIGLTDLKEYSMSEYELVVTDEKKWLLAQIKYPELIVK